MTRSAPARLPRARAVLAAAAILACAQPALAFRPLLTDDASVNPAGTCQLETWFQREHALDLFAAAPACGIGFDAEVGVELTRTRPRVDDRGGVALQLKGVMPSLAAGGWTFGYKVGASALRNEAARDRRPDLYQALAIASGPLADGLTMHLNLGAARQQTGERRDLALYGVALTYELGPRAFVFAELLGDHRSGAFRNAGARWWLIPERLGVDLSVGRQAGAPDSTVVAIGIAYYGIGVFD